MSRGNRSHERTAQEREADRQERERRRAEREGRDASLPASERLDQASLDSEADAPSPHLADEVQPLAPAPEPEPEPIDDPPPTPSEPEPIDARVHAPHDPAPLEPVPGAVDEPVAPSAVEQETAEHVAPHAYAAADEAPGAYAAAEGDEHYDGYRSPDAGERPETPAAREPSGEPHPPVHEEDRELPAWEVARERSTPATAASTHPNLVVGQRMREPDGGLAGGGGRGRSQGGRRRGPGGGGGSRLTRARLAALVALLAAAALVWFLVSLLQPFAGEGSGKVIVSIPKGSSSSKIGSILARDGVVSSGFFFDVRTLLDGKRGSLHSGRFALKRDMSYSAAIDALSKPPPRAIAVKVVIPEGYTRRQIAELVGEDALTGDYLAQTKSSPLLDPAHYGAPAGTPDLEGFLFPATYDLTAGTPVQRLVDDQLTAFRQRFTHADVRRAHALGVTPYQLLTVASMIEREAQTEHDRPLIAAVIYNRLREGIPLGIDATIYYAVEQQMNVATYTGELTDSQLRIDSPYNTRTHKGLPPTPISNPGEASIQAAAHPAHKRYLYYVAAADGCGEQAFSDTYAQFEKNVAAYQAAVKKNGGHPPKCKKK